MKINPFTKGNYTTKIMILLRFYKKEIDRVWFDSSSVFYAECDDTSNTVYKTVKVLFKSGVWYEYSNVQVNDWLMFVLHESAGKGLREYIINKKYDYKKIDNPITMEELNDEYNLRIAEKTISISINDNDVVISNGKEEAIHTIKELSNPEEVAKALNETLLVLNYNIISDKANNNE